MISREIEKRWGRNRYCESSFFSAALLVVVSNYSDLVKYEKTAGYSLELAHCQRMKASKRKALTKFIISSTSTKTEGHRAPH